MDIQFLKECFKNNLGAQAIIWRDCVYDYSWLLERLIYWDKKIEDSGILSGHVVAMDADYSPETVAIFLSLMERSAIIVPITTSTKESIRDQIITVSNAEFIIKINQKDDVVFQRNSAIADQLLYKQLRKDQKAGLVLFSSGSSGAPKAVVHDLTLIIEKFKVKRHARRSIIFLLFDHIGGINTMLYSLSNAGCLIMVSNRSPDDILMAIEKYKADTLPTSPTFISLILLSHAYERHDLSSLQLVTYGTEPMPESTLKRFHQLFPKITLQQTYGLSELGILRSKSKSSDSLWVKIGGEGFQTKILDGILFIKASSSMLGYLNAPSPFTDDGWFRTGDRVEQDGEYIKFLGRESDIINVGGEKVNPVEVECVIQEMDNVLDAIVYSENNFIMGSIVCANITIKEPVVDQKVFIKNLKKHCSIKLAGYKIPVKIKISEQLQYNRRFKKDRKGVCETQQS